MHSRSWITLLERIPKDQQDQYSLVTSSGTEISLQNILRMEEDYVIVRGRLAGTTDMGRVYLVPYDQLNYVGSQKELNEGQIQALCGTLPAMPPRPCPPAVPESPAGESPESFSPEQEAARVADSPRPAERLAIPGKEILLQRLRARTQAAHKPPSP